MSWLHFTFETAAFADTEEFLSQNINRIEGHALAVWLSGELGARGLEASQCWAEDHGWDFSIVHLGAKYICACALERDSQSAAEGHVTLHKSRSLMDKLMGRNKFEANDAVAAALRAALNSNGDVMKLGEEI